MTKLVELNLNPDDRMLRQFGWIAFVVFSALAALAFGERWLFAFGLGELRFAVAAGLLAAALGSALASWLLPRANKPLYVGLSLLSFPIGVVVSYVIMALLYFGLFAPLALLFRIVGRDGLQRRYDRGAATYWRDARGDRDKSKYFRQY